MLGPIGKITTPIAKTAKSVVKAPLNWYGNYTNIGGMKKVVDVLGDTKAMDKIALIGVLSCVTKDALGCYLYVKQSMSNKDIPKDKRGFVAALDLVNGVFMIGMQLLTFARRVSLVRVCMSGQQNSMNRGPLRKQALS